MRAKILIPIIVIVGIFLIPSQMPAVVKTSPIVTTPSEHSLSQGYDLQRVGTLEAIVTQIDPSGTVRNLVTTFQNASYYGTSYVQPYQDIVEHQTLNSKGFVSEAQLEIANRIVYPNGRYGGPGMSLTLLINPIIVIPAISSNTYLVEPEISDVISLGDEMVAQYEDDLGVEFQRFSTTRQMLYVYTSYGGGYFSTNTWQYQVEYVSMVGKGEIDMPMNTLRDRLAGLGGFMGLLNASGWPLNRTTLAESMVFDHHSYSNYYSYMMNPYAMIAGLSRAYVRSDISHAQYSENIYTAVIGMAGFDAVEFISDAAGNETYSLKQHIGYTGNIQSKMYQDMTINSLSAVIAATPSVLGGVGFPDEWDFVGKDFTFNTTGPMMYLPNNEYVYGTDPIEKYFEALINWYPRSFGMSLYSSISYIDPTSFDSLIDNFWGGTGPIYQSPDIRDALLQANYSYTFANSPLVELNQDLLRNMLENVNITAQTLINNLNDTLFEKNPTEAIFEAFLTIFDNYHLLDIFRNTSYVNPVAFEQALDDFFQNINQFLSNFTGIDLPSSYRTKDAFTALIEDHFGLMLQAVWDAMSNYVGSTSQIKTAVQAVLQPDHLIDETVPYFWTDIYSSIVEEYDYGMWLNFELPVYTGMYEPYNPPLLWLNTNDIVLEFDLNIESISYEGPHLVVTKAVQTPQMNTGTTTIINITVKNIGDARAYDIKVLDGITAGFETDKRYYWNRATLDPGASWQVTGNITALETGEFVEVPAVVCYFSQPLSTYPTADPLTWSGAAMYTFSTIGRQIVVHDAPTPWWETEFMGIPITIFIIGGAAGSILVIVLVLRLRKPSGVPDFSYV